MLEQLKCHKVTLMLTVNNKIITYVSSAVKQPEHAKHCNSGEIPITEEKMSGALPRVLYIYGYYG